MMECKEATSLESYFLFLANFSHDRAKEVILQDTDVPICVELCSICLFVAWVSLKLYELLSKSCLFSGGGS